MLKTQSAEFQAHCRPNDMLSSAWTVFGACATKTGASWSLLTQIHSLLMHKLWFISQLQYLGKKKTFSTSITEEVPVVIIELLNNSM